jgi:hypothetical protein
VAEIKWIEMDGRKWVAANGGQPVGTYETSPRTFVIQQEPTITSRFWLLRWDGRLPRKTKKALKLAFEHRPHKRSSSLRQFRRLLRAVRRAHLDADLSHWRGISGTT